jgi:hypothetical protein
MGEFVERSSDPSRRPPTLAAAYAELNALLLEAPSVREFIADLAALAASIVPGSRCVIALRRVRVGTTGAPERGPEEESVDGDQARADEAVQRVTPQAVAGEVAIPLRVNGTDIGTLRIFPEARQTFAAAELDLLRAFARQAVVALTLLMRQSAHTVLDAELQDALATRAVIDQALGVLMHARKISSRQAFEVLRQASQTSNRKVSAVAAEVIQAMTGHPPERPRPLTQRDPLFPPEPTSR